MIGIVLASHGDLAAGALQTSSMVFGEQEGVAVASLRPSMGPDEFRVQLEEAVETFEDREQVLFLVDLWGGTPFNQINGLLDSHPGWAAVMGLNLPMLIEAFVQRMDPALSAAELAARLVAAGGEGIRMKPEPVAGAVAGGSAGCVTGPDATAAVGSGPAQIAWVRIDSRLLHGQVAMAWSKQIKPTRIIVVSDSVAHDDLRKSLIVEAAPPGIKANVIPIQKLVDIAGDVRFGGQRFLLLFENPTDVLRAVEGGVPLGSINVGSLAHSAGKTMLNDAVSVDEGDVTSFRALRDAGCTFVVQKVPADKPSDIWPLLEKAGLS